MQDGLVPPLHPEEAAGIITGSEQILKEYAKKASLTAKDIIALIEDVLHNPDFNADDVDTDMLKRFADSIDSGDLEIISMHQEGDGAQKLDLFKRPAEKVLRELIGDIRLAGCQHFAFKEYLDPHGNRLFAGHSNGSISFQLAQIRVGPDKVPVSLVIYIDATYIKKGIPIRPIYCELFCSIAYDVVYDVAYDQLTLTPNMFQWVVSTTTGLSCQRHLHGDRWHCCLYSRLQHAEKRTRIG